MYQRKPGVIEAVELTEELVPFFTEPLQVFEHRACIRWAFEDATVFIARGRRGAQLPEYEVWNQAGRAWVGVRIGDFIRVDMPGDIYPIPRDVFEGTYDLVQEGP